MKPAALLCVTLITLLHCGCAIEPDDREFYYRHWTHPSSMDDPHERAEDEDFTRRFWKGP